MQKLNATTFDAGLASMGDEMCMSIVNSDGASCCTVFQRGSSFTAASVWAKGDRLARLQPV
jgi:hypothetical protein